MLIVTKVNIKTMAGCFGTSIFDRNIEYTLDKYLDSQEEYYCEECFCREPYENWEYISNKDTIVCPCCGNEITRPDDLIPDVV